MAKSLFHVCQPFAWVSAVVKILCVKPVVADVSSYYGLTSDQSKIGLLKLTARFWRVEALVRGSVSTALYQPHGGTAEVPEP